MPADLEAIVEAARRGESRTTPPRWSETVEERQKHYLKLPKEGKLPEPSETAEKDSHEAASG